MKFYNQFSALWMLGVCKAKAASSVYDKSQVTCYACAEACHPNFPVIGSAPTPGATVPLV